MRVGENLGEIVLVKIEKKKYWVHDDWYCRYITVKTPSGDYVEFPCFRWLVDDKEVVLRDGRGRVFSCLTHHLSPLFHQSEFAAQKHKTSPVPSLTFVLFPLQHICLRMIRPAWSNSTDKKSWIWREKPTSKFALHIFGIVCCRRLRLLTNNSAVLYRWREWQPGFPMSIDATRHKDLPRDIQFDSEKGVDFVLNYSKAYVLPLTACWCKALTG